MSKIVVHSLTKQYGDIVALNDVNLKLEPNKIYGLLGRNGAGKSTLLNLMTNKLFPTSGEILIDDESVIENDCVLNKIFYMVEKNLFPLGYKIKEIFKWTKEFYPSFDLDYAKELCDKFGLDTKLKIKALSTGYLTIFKDILALASQAEILLLDEPVLGLDANHRDLLYKEIISNFIEHPKTILISTHLIDEVADILEEVIIIKEGNIIVQNSVEKLLMSAYRISGEASRVDEYLKNRKHVGAETMGKYKSTTVLEDIKDKDMKLINELDLEVSKAPLQKLFISLTN
ncbi:ABC transporter ATP-binding protein [Mycoplasmatota bacterium]|nr:ABC transporter ATP-binding protein [Mycoplasmatota bacterium]